MPPKPPIALESGDELELELGLGPIELGLLSARRWPSRAISSAIDVSMLGERHARTRGRDDDQTAGDLLRIGPTVTLVACCGS